MSERRIARGGAAGDRSTPGTVLPAELASGPCIEDWAERGSTHPQFSARRRWAQAVDDWARSSGWATATNPASNARNLARTRLPWSRAFLLSQGRAEYVAWLDGHRGEPPETQVPRFARCGQ